jgi:hypothetical protein
MQSIQVFLTKISSRHFFNSSFYKKYLTTLELYWHQRRKNALQYIAKTIEEDIDHQDIHLFYRLWIEILSDDRDFSSLQKLKDHLIHMAPYFKDYDQWAALRGLVHLELEELDACVLILRAVRDNTYSPYAMELRQRYSLRVADDMHTDLAILNCQAPINDFFVLQALARGLLVNGESEHLSSLLSKLSGIFSHSPLQDQFLFWQKFEENQLSEAIQVGERLCHRFPNNEIFRFNLAYTHFCNGNLDGAVNGLEEFDIRIRKNDPDTLALLGYGYLLKSRDKKDSKNWEKARHYFTLAQTQATKLGIPNSESLINLHFMKGASKKNSSRISFWTLPITPRRESEFMESAEKSVDFLFHELQNDIREDDIVLLTGTSSRVLGVYKVNQTHVWHPYVKNQGFLELIHRFSRSVEIPEFRSFDRSTPQALTEEQREFCLDTLEEHAPLREKIQHPPQKQLVRQLRKIS